MARSFHTHQLGRLVIGCQACIEQTRAAEQAARWEQAPVRKVTWKCTYMIRTRPNRTEVHDVSFTLEVKVPDDATGDEVDARYAEITGEAFVLALPDTVPMDHTTYAAETMDVEHVTIGARVNTATAPSTLDQLDLFAGDVPA